MTQTIFELTWYNQCLLLTLVLYGVKYGVRNTVGRTVCAFRRKSTWVQGNLYGMLDFLFYLGIIYFTVFVFKVFG